MAGLSKRVECMVSTDTDAVIREVQAELDPGGTGRGFRSEAVRTLLREGAAARERRKLRAQQ
jgi:hypothetical protein